MPPKADTVATPLVPPLQLTLVADVVVIIALTDTVTEAFTGQPYPLLMITEYVVVIVGEAIGFAIRLLLKVEEGDQL